eukprot:gnl/TRDRNA2_/TRDRNA2_159547_c1_seq1.p1 gnl/TRDRNA2_/TRDRNA2_159547_c1~~gnl/TRDRNA2_/TRDRNA2_159547_c1_seq1.p1  ORF type:complete len:770 (+),score=154.29 gnl/TRDRNA2_/TRDRNA2_159547_c1_seq1:125-2311(+)
MPRLEACLSKMHEYGIKGSAVTYGTIVKAYGKAGNIEKVLQAWADMSREGLEANAVTYGCMLDACVKCGHLEKALHVFSLMKEQGLHRNTILYATLIKGFAKAKNPMSARNLYGEMVAEGVMANVVVFNSLIDACVRASDLHGAAEVLQQMTAAGVQPDLITFSTLIKGYCSSGELNKALRLSDELTARRLECDEVVYNSLLEGCVKAGDLTQGLRLFNEMRQRNVRPSSVTFSILVKLLSRAGRMDLAVHLVHREMSELHGVPPTRMVWSCLVTCCVKARDLTRAVMVLELMDREGSAAGSARMSMYATVIEGCLVQGEIAIAIGLCERAYSRAPPEEGHRGLLSVDLLRRVFEAVPARGPEAEARHLLETLSARLSEPVRASLEEALARGARRRAPHANASSGGGGRDSNFAGRDAAHNTYGGAARGGLNSGEGLTALSSGTSPNGSSAFTFPSDPAAALCSGGYGSASMPGAPPPISPMSHWPPVGGATMPNHYMPGAYGTGFEAPGGIPGMHGLHGVPPHAGLHPGGFPPAWDPAAAAAAAAAAANSWFWPSPMPGMGGEGYPGSAAAAAAAYAYGAEQYYQHPGVWGDGGLNAWDNGAAAAAPWLSAQVPPAGQAPAAPPAPKADPPTPPKEEVDRVVADTPKPQPKGTSAVDTPSQAGSGIKASERTPATTAGRLSSLGSPDEEDDGDDSESSPLQKTLFKGDAACAGDAEATLLERPPGLC